MSRPLAITTSIPARRSVRNSAGGAEASVTASDAVRRPDDDRRPEADLRAVGDEDDPIGLVERRSLDLGLLVGQLGDAPAARDPGCPDDGQVESIRRQGPELAGPDAAQLIGQDGAAQADDPDGPRSQEARDRQRPR